MNICCISDTHGKEKNLTYILPSADVLIFAGDASRVGDLHEIQNFADWLNYIKIYYSYIIVIAGNHDWAFQRQPNAAKKYITDAGAIYLENNDITLEGIKFWGSPATREFNKWAFNYTEEKLKTIWETIPDDVNVLINHSMPVNILDYSSYQNKNVGEIYLAEKIKTLKQLKLYIGGHIHDSGGKAETVNEITYINASVCNDQYKLTNKPVLVNLNKKNEVTIIKY